MDEYVDVDLLLAIKLSEEIESSSKNNSVRIQDSVLPEDEDEDLLLAIKLSEKIESQHSRQSTPTKQNSKDTQPTNDENEDFQWAIELSEEVESRHSSQNMLAEQNGYRETPKDDDLLAIKSFRKDKAASRIESSPENDSVQILDNVLTEDEDLLLAIKLSEKIESQHSRQSTPTKQSLKDMHPTNNENEDFQWAIKLWKETESRHSSRNLFAKQHGYRETPKDKKGEAFSQQNRTKRSDLADMESNIDEDLRMAIKLSEQIESQALQKETSRDIDFDYALKLSQQLNGDKLVTNSELKTTDDDDYLLAVQIANESSEIEMIDVDMDEVDDRGVRDTATRRTTPSSSRSYENDYLLAVQLSLDSASEVIDHDDNYKQAIKSTATTSVSTFTDKNRKSLDKYKYMDKTLSIVDPSWETIDPTPDIHALFIAFNKRFFWGRLDMVEVKWSPRMTSCAGICSYRSRAGHCIVSLSKPLLQLRPRKDLVETLLHEMIHAYLFVTKNNRDRDGHGPQFHEHMYRINRESGTRITVYHSFHDEVKSYQVHWWRCDGPCQQRPPFYGMVKRAMNRAPGPNDLWWSDHLATCGGTYHKIKEPENFAKKKSDKGKKVEVDKSGKTTNIANFFNHHTGSSQLGGSTPSSTGKPPATVDSGRLIHAGNVSRFDKPSTSTASWSSQTVATATKSASTFGSNKIVTLTDLSRKLNQRSPSKGSPKKWVPLPGQQNILQFINKS